MGQQRASAQSAEPGRRAAALPRSYGGWQRATEPKQDGDEIRFYQAQGSLSDAGLPALPRFDANNGMPQESMPSGLMPPALPPEGGRGGASAAPGTLPSAPPVLPDVPSNGLRSGAGTGTVPAAVLQSNASVSGSRGVPAATAQLSASAGRSGSAGQAAPTGLRNIQGQGGNAAAARVASPAESSPTGARLDPRSITTGLPYVTPAPGRYPTSPLNPVVFQTVAYQQAVPAAGPAGNGAAGVLPQNAQPPAAGGAGWNVQPGIYPTSYQCAPAGGLQPGVPSTGAVGGNFVPPTLTPNWNPNLYAPNNAGFRLLLTLGQENYNVVLGRGIIGQPTVYVPGQNIRNFLRYIFP
ncbi:MAG: hypothetical protein D6753_17415 [Planctomycetota bacterium]|nr:MAG: hypothetical protein D6753_17415 [Planctomycetota bacterium]